MRSGPIVIIEDDEADVEIVCQALDELEVKNRRILLQNGADALDYLRTAHEQPFIILCDINLPKLSGIELRAAIDEDEKLRRKSIPFIFFSTSASASDVRKAYEESVQGFFLKGNSYAEIKELLRLMVAYWRECVHPNALREG